MARPTKKEQQIKTGIKELNILVRDNTFYTFFENETENLSVFKISYYFCQYCRNRALANHRVENIDSLHDIEYKVLESLSTYIPENEKLQYMKLFNLDKLLYYRLLHLFLNDTPYIDDEKYQVINLVEENALTQAFGEDALEYFFTYSERIPFYYLDKENIPVETKAKEIIKNQDFSSISLILDNKIYPAKEEYVDKNRSTFVELDFTKPLDELIEFIKTIKTDFDEDPKVLQTLYDLTDGGQDIYTCDLAECDIYTTNNTKPIGGRLADALFIYDCKKAGLDNEYILGEIDRYWIEVKNLYPDSMQQSTLRNYHRFATEYIDEKKYKCHISGYNLPQSNIFP